MAGDTDTNLLTAQADHSTTETPAADTHETMPAADDHAAPVAADSHGDTGTQGATDTHADPTGDTHATTEAHGGEHGEAHGAFPPFDGSTFANQLVWLAITFAALYLLMSRIALPRIGEILEVRRDRIEGDLAEAERLRQKTDQAISSYEAALADAKSKAHGIAEETRSKIKADIDAKRADVETDLTKKVSEAEGRIQKTKDAALENVDEIAAETAQALAEQLVGKVTQKAARDAVAKAIAG